jgi:hypothetical protein
MPNMSAMQPRYKLFGRIRPNKGWPLENGTQQLTSACINLSKLDILVRLATTLNAKVGNLFVADE